jgi:hypothetical protein
MPTPHLRGGEPVFEKLYKSVRDGTETRNALEFDGHSMYREGLSRELEECLIKAPI